MSSRPGAAIVVDGVTKTFGAVVALDDVSVALDESAVGLLGANGAGKSTLMRTLLGLIRPDRGHARVLGIDTSGRAGDVRSRIGYMPEHDCLPRGMAARDLVVHLGELRGLPRRAAVLRTSEVLFQVGLEEERTRLIGTFSTGMKQRVKLAQALVHSPELVVLDEPTNGLDPSGRDEMLTLVRRLSSDLGVRVLFSSHVLEDVERTCDAVIVLRDGKVVASDRIDALRSGAGTRLSVRISGDHEAFARALRAHGLEDTAVDGAFVITAADDAALDALRDAAATAGVSLRELVPAVRTLEDTLIGAMQ